MSEPISACISIGGKLPRKLVAPLCEAINADRVSLEWGDAFFQPKTVTELLEACDKERGVNVLWLCDDQANWGRLPHLEDFLTNVGKLPFDLRTDGKLGIDPDLVAYRPGNKPMRILTTASGDLVISAQLMAPIVKSLAKAVEAKGKQECQTGARRALKRLHAILPPTLTPLPPFEIG